MIKRIVFVLSVLLVSASALFAQQMPVIPADPEVRVGKLENGITYYIRHNGKPEKQAEFYILHDVGAIQEDDSQIGLAHFLEHMAFNGTKNFPDKNLINYLETIGVKFGANLNAGTGQELTVYNMSNVPLLREGIIDSCLLILHDWSYFITLDPKEIDKERGVIVEELRQHNTASFRISEILDKTTYNNSLYAYRNVIGTEENLRNFKPETLKDFYHKWYRTDLQAIVVVGDFDVDQMEARIKKIMADIPAVQNPAPKVPVAIPNNDEPLIGIATDPEMTATRVTIMVKRDPVPEQYNNTVNIAQVNMLLDVITDMASNRVREIVQKPGAPFINGMIGQGSMTQTCDVIQAIAIAREGEAAKAFEAMYVELEKIQRYGFTESELERVKSEKLRAAEQRYDNRADRRNSEFVWTYLSNFRDNYPMPDAQTEWQIDSALLSNMNLAVVNQLSKALITDENQVVTIAGPAKEGVATPTKEDIQAIIKKVRDGEVEAYADNVVKEPLVTAQLKAVPVKKTETDKFGATVWTLANGAKVIIKKTDFKADEVRMNVNTHGGLSLVSDADYVSGESLSGMMNLSGVGKFSATDLQKQLAGKAVSIYPTLSSYEHGFSGSVSPKDFETMLQLLYLYFTQPRFEKADFDVLVDRYESQVANIGSNPMYAMQKHLTEKLYNNSPRRQVLSAEYVKMMDFEAMKRIYSQLYGSAGNFTYTFVGNLDPAVAKPLVEKYIGSLPAPKAKMTWKDDKVEMAKGQQTDRFTFAMQVPKTTIVEVMNGPATYNLATKLTGSILDQILDIRYTESIREEKGGTYGVSVSFSQTDVPKPQYIMQIFFETDPKMADELMEIVTKELQEMADNGPSAEDMSKIKEFMVKQRQDDLKLNGQWLNWIDTYYINGADMTTGYDDALNAVDAKAVQALVKKILSDGNVLKVVMDPAAEAVQ